jgi:hypothetical protein
MAIFLALLGLAVAFWSGFWSAAIFTARNDRNPSVIPTTAKVGFKTGMLGSCLAFGAVAAANVLRSFVSATSPADPFGDLAWFTVAVFLAAGLGGGLFGVIGAVGGLLVKSPGAALHFLAVLFNIEKWRWERQRPDQPTYFARALYTLALLCLASPVLLVLRPLFEAKPSAPPSVQAVPSVPAESFRYDPPANFGAASAHEIGIFARKPLPPIERDAPAAFAPDGVRFACFASGARELRIVDTASLETIATLALPESVNRMAWSPDSSRLFVVGVSRAGSTLGIVDIGKGEHISLPQPPYRDMPSGQPHWSGADSIEFYPADEPPLAYFLDTLRLLPIQGAEPPTATELPTSARRRMTAAQRAHLVIPPPRREPAGEWGHQYAVSLGFEDLQDHTQNVLSDVPLDEGDIINPSRDGSRAVLLTSKGAEIVYFTVVEATARSLTCTLPQEAEGLSLVASTEDELPYLAYVYGPETNPLNGKVIGPDRGDVRARVQIKSADAEGFQAVVVEGYRDVRPGDIVAEFLAPVLESDRTYFTGQHQWAVVQTVKGDPVAAELPKRAFLPAFDTAPSGLRFRGFEVPQPKMPKPAPKPEAVSSPPPLETEPNPPSFRDQLYQAEIEAFILEHHRKASLGDIRGVVADYAPVSEYLGRSVSRDDLEKELEAYRKLWRTTSESVSDLQITESVPGRTYEAHYILSFAAESASTGKKLTGTSSMALTIARERIFQIKSQRSQPIATEEEEAPAVVALDPPEIPQEEAKPKDSRPAVTVPRPCWIGSHEIERPFRMRIVDQIHVKYNGATWHRTYQELGPDGSVRRSCTSEYGGEVTSPQKGQVRIYISKMKLADGGNAAMKEEIKLLHQYMFRQRMLFSVSGDDLYEPTLGITFKLTR